jgi:hypothetical protein
MEKYTIATESLSKRLDNKCKNVAQAKSLSRAMARAPVKKVAHRDKPNSMVESMVTRSSASIYHKHIYPLLMNKEKKCEFVACVGAVLCTKVIFFSEYR